MKYAHIVFTLIDRVWLVVDIVGMEEEELGMICPTIVKALISCKDL